MGGLGGGHEWGIKTVGNGDMGGGMGGIWTRVGTMGTLGDMDMGGNGDMGGI